jgi:hypothetical protein
VSTPNSSSLLSVAAASVDKNSSISKYFILNPLFHLTFEAAEQHKDLTSA